MAKLSGWLRHCLESLSLNDRKLHNERNRLAFDPFVVEVHD